VTKVGTKNSSPLRYADDKKIHMEKIGMRMRPILSPNQYSNLKQYPPMLAATKIQHILVTNPTVDTVFWHKSGL
jgi:hypothetical protein